LSDQQKTEENITIIKKYANRRLYNTASSSYVTLDDLSSMVKAGEDFVVRDAKTEEDITRSVLTQIIFEEEAKGQNLLPISFLRQLIGFYGDSMQAVVPSYLDHAMSVFTQGQEKLHEQVSSAFGGADVFKMGEEMAKQNMAMFEQAVGMFNPTLAAATRPRTKTTTKATTPAASEPASEPAGEKSGDDLDILKDQLTAMQHQLDALSKNKS
jgi:polyhydroxyalkanoate synthesis repressor PhaR